MKVTAMLAMFVAGVSAGSPVGKVIELINELKVKVENDLKAEGSAMAEYSTFCDDEQTAKGFAIKTAASDIEGYSAVIEETTGTIQQLSATIETAGAEVAAKQSELESATSVRANENGDFKAAEKELVDAIDTLGRAVTIIKREMSFAQGAKGAKNVAKKLEAMSGALSQIISAAYIDSSSRKKLQSFLSTSTEADDELSLHQPQAATYAYESKSGGIVSTLEDMKDKAEGNLNDLRREEMKSKHAFELIKQSLTDSVAVLNKQIDQSTASSAAAQEKLGKAQGDLSSTEAAKKADEEYVSKLTAECDAKASEWSERQASARSEIEALNKGSEILTAKFGGSFAQVSMSVKKTSTMIKDDASREKAIEVLKKLGRQFNSFAMMQIANAAGKDPFAKVRGLIESMIAKLEQQAQEEATHDAFCKEETVKSAKAKETKQANVDKLQARIDEAKAATAELKQEVATLSEEIAEIDGSMKKAQSMRNTEHADFLAASKDFKESAEAITQALVVLKDFYKAGEEALIQQGPSFGAARSDASHMILEILEVAQEDFTRLLAEAETTEAESSEAFKALTQDNEVARAKKESSIQSKTSEIKSIEVALTHHNEDYDTVSAELAAVMDYIEKLKPQCESKAMTYEERKARREAEIAGLQEALTILSGDDVAAFIQKRGFLHRKL
jgi:chromosome segregation ATPase